MTPVFFGLTAFLFGLIVGSFLNVCIYRLPRGESLIYPPSHCPNCYQPIKAEDNIPVISWLTLGGRCRFCKTRISFIYPAVELLTGLLFLVYYWRLLGFEWSPTGSGVALYVIHIAFLSALLVSTVIDFRFFIIPDEITLPGTFVAVIASLALPAMHADRIIPSYPHLNSFFAAIIGALTGAGIIYGIGAVGKLLIPKEKLAFGGEAMGLGDVKLMAMIGAVLGWQLTVFVLVFSALLGTIYGLIRLSVTGDNKIQYGPFLSIAAAFCLLMGDQVNTFIARVVDSYRILFR